MISNNMRQDSTAAYPTHGQWSEQDTTVGYLVKRIEVVCLGINSHTTSQG